jgi:hypothetical protein
MDVNVNVAYRVCAWCAAVLWSVSFECHRRFGANCCLLRTSQRCQRLLVALLCDYLGGVLPHAMQRLGRVVRSEISAVTPDAAIVHQAVLEKYRPAVADIIAAEYVSSP